MPYGQIYNVPLNCRALWANGMEHNVNKVALRTIKMVQRTRKETILTRIILSRDVVEHGERPYLGQWVYSLGMGTLSRWPHSNHSLPWKTWSFMWKPSADFIYCFDILLIFYICRLNVLLTIRLASWLVDPIINTPCDT